jgi:hypothetical protein
MDWLLGGPAAPFLVEEDDFDAALAPPPPGIFFDNGMDAGVVFCPAHGYGPCPARHGVPATPPQEHEVIDAYPDLPMPMPSDEASEHFLPPGFGPILGLESPPAMPPAASPFGLDLNIKAELEEAPVLLPPLTPAAPSSPAPAASALLPPPALALAALASPAPAISSPPSPSPEARRLLRRFASAMATDMSQTYL